MSTLFTTPRTSPAHLPGAYLVRRLFKQQLAWFWPKRVHSPAYYIYIPDLPMNYADITTQHRYVCGHAERMVPRYVYPTFPGPNLIQQACSALYVWMDGMPCGMSPPHSMYLITDGQNCIIVSCSKQSECEVLESTMRPAECQPSLGKLVTPDCENCVIVLHFCMHQCVCMMMHDQVNCMIVCVCMCMPCENDDWENLYAHKYGRWSSFI